jgi:hypothetical protein
MTIKDEDKKLVGMKLSKQTAEALADLIYENRGTTREGFITRSIELVRMYGMTDTK